MSKIVLISGSPSATSKSASLLGFIRENLLAAQLEAQIVSIRDFPAEELILGKYDSPVFAEFNQSIAAASGLVVSTPIYKAAYTGGLKALLDILPQSAFRGKTVFPLATGGSPAHLLAIDYALKPVLSALGATDQLQGVYAVDKEITLDASGRLAFSEELQERLNKSIEHFIANVKRA